MVGVQPHSLALPLPPQVCGAVHEPQLIVPPQPLEIVPQLSPAGQVVTGVQPHSLALPLPPQVWGAVQAPQLSVPPQPFGIVPQLSPAGQVETGLQPHSFAVPPPPQVWGAVQTPQLSVLPQLSEIVPQLAPRAAHVVQPLAGVTMTENFVFDVLCALSMAVQVTSVFPMANTLPDGGVHWTLVMQRTRVGVHGGLSFAPVEQST